MIQVFTGEDTQKARKAAQLAFEEAKSGNNDASLMRFTDISFDSALATDAFTSENLFGDGNILYFEGILEHPDGESFYRTTLKTTDHLVIIYEAVIPKDLLAFFERIAEIKEFKLTQKPVKQENSFAIADAVGIRDKKRAWVEFEKVRRRGAVMEEVHGTIFWAYKSMYLTLMLPKDEVMKTGMKEFIYRNYFGFAKKYLISELEQKLFELKEMYHRAHRGEGELDIALEQFLLKL